ncbi:MAG: hypothetical protein FWG42_10775 [Clostridiales bacterium]|nr:hypothetical protein [Clostridiales bacterium]
MGVKYVENPPGSRFVYDVVDDPTTEDDRREFRKARISHGWVPENPSAEEKALILEVDVKVKRIEGGWVPENPTEEEKSLIYRVGKRKAAV